MIINVIKIIYVSVELFLKNGFELRPGFIWDTV